MSTKKLRKKWSFWKSGKTAKRYSYKGKGDPIKAEDALIWGFF